MNSIVTREARAFSCFSHRLDRSACGGPPHSNHYWKRKKTLICVYSQFGSRCWLQTSARPRPSLLGAFTIRGSASIGTRIACFLTPWESGIEKASFGITSQFTSRNKSGQMRRLSPNPQVVLWSGPSTQRKKRCRVFILKERIRRSAIWRVRYAPQDINDPRRDVRFVHPRVGLVAIG